MLHRHRHRCHVLYTLCTISSSLLYTTACSSELSVSYQSMFILDGDRLLSLLHVFCVPRKIYPSRKHRIESDPLNFASSHALIFVHTGIHCYYTIMKLQTQLSRFGLDSHLPNHFSSISFYTPSLTPTSPRGLHIILRFRLKIDSFM